MPEVFDIIKKLLRLNGNALDDVVKFNINAGLDDLADQGIDIDSQDNLVVKAVELYCKWQMNFNGKGDEFCNNYRKLADTMSKQESHRVGDSDV